MSLIQITKNIFIDPKQVSSLEIGVFDVSTHLCAPYLKIAMKSGESFTIYNDYKEVFDRLKPLMEITDA